MLQRGTLEKEHLSSLQGCFYWNCIMAQLLSAKFSFLLLHSKERLKGTSNKCVYVSLTESGSQATLWGHQTSFPLPFVSFSLSSSLSLFLPLPVRLCSFSPPLLSDFLPHSLLTFQNSFLCSYSCSVTVPVASAIGSHPEALYWVEVPILQLPWVLVYNSLHLQTSLEDCP